MMFRYLFALVMVGLMSGATFAAGIVDDNSGYDFANTGPWSAAAWRDNIAGSPDNWLGYNGAHLAKASYGDADGTAAAAGFAGVTRTSGGDVAELTYSFTAGGAIAAQDWIVKNTVNTSLVATTNDARAVRMQMSVSVNGSPFTIVETTPYFATPAAIASLALPGDTVDIGGGGYFDAWAIDGPELALSTDLSSLGITAGDSVVYKFALPQNDPSSASSKWVGLGVQLNVPEPSSLALLGVAGLAMIRRRR